MAVLLKLKFWIGAALIALVAVVMYFMLVRPIARENKTKRAELIKRAEELKSYASGRRDVKNELWIEQARKEKELVEGKVKEVIELMGKRDDPLEQAFVDEESKQPITDPGIWRGEYERRMRAMKTELQESGCEFGGQAPLVERTFGDLLPRKEEMEVLQQQYWVQKTVVDLIVNLNVEQGKVVPVFSSLRFRGDLYRPASPAHPTKFRPIPMQLKVAMEFRDVPLLLQTLLNSPLGFEVERVSITRRPRGLGISLPAVRRPVEPKETVPPPLRPGEEMRPPGEMEPGMRRPGERRPAERAGGLAAEGTGAAQAAPPRSETLVGVSILFYVPDFVEAGAS
jgi:hypothetical protein